MVIRKEQDPLRAKVEFEAVSTNGEMTTEILHAILISNVLWSNMRPVKKLRPTKKVQTAEKVQPTSLNMIPREEALAALNIYFFVKRFPKPIYGVDNKIVNSQQIMSERNKLTYLKDEFTRIYGHAWKSTSDEIWKENPSSFFQTPQEIYEAYIKRAIKLKPEPTLNTDIEVKFDLLLKSDKEPVKLIVAHSSDDDNEEKEITYWLYKV